VDDTPRSILEVFASLDVDDWKEAIRSKMDSIMMNETCEVVDRPFGCKPVGCSKRNSSLMVLLRSTRLDLLQKGIHKKERTSLILTHLLPG
jgi:hypothetical protein